MNIPLVQPLTQGVVAFRLWRIRPRQEGEPWRLMSVFQSFEWSSQTMTAKCESTLPLAQPYPYRSSSTLHEGEPPHQAPAICGIYAYSTPRLALHLQEKRLGNQAISHCWGAVLLSGRTYVGEPQPQHVGVENVEGVQFRAARARILAFHHIDPRPSGVAEVSESLGIPILKDELFLRHITEFGSLWRGSSADRSE